MIIFTLKTGFILTDLNSRNLMVTQLIDEYRVNIIDYGEVTYLSDESEKNKVIQWFTMFLSTLSQNQIIKVAEFFNIVNIKRTFSEIGGIYKARLKQNVIAKFKFEILYFTTLTSNIEQVQELLTNPSIDVIHRLLMIISIIGIISIAIAYESGGNLQCMGILKHIYNRLPSLISDDAKMYPTIYYFFTKIGLNIDYNEAVAKDTDIEAKLTALIQNIKNTMSICIMPRQSGIEHVFSESKSVTQTGPQIHFGLVGTALGGGYNNSNHKKIIRKNKYRFSKRPNKRKNKRTHKRKYKRTNKRKYKRTNKRKTKK
jgi:hypothetical protein